MSTYDRNAGKPGARPNYWVKYIVNGDTVREPGKESKKASAAWEAELKRQVRAGTWVHPKLRRGDRARFDNYARTVLARRIARGVLTADKDERGHIENHLVPMFGKMRVDELTFRVIKTAFSKYTDGTHAGRTVRNIHSTLRSILIEAAEDGLIDTAPTPLSVKRDHLPPPRDKDPKWRRTAQFDRAEVAALVGCSDVLTMRRVMYATYFLTGSRAQELLPLLVSDYLPMDPWPALAVRAEKTGRHVAELTRYAPVAPELRAWLDWWLEDEYEVLVGHKPQPGDALFPTLSKRRRNRGELFCSRNEIYKLWLRHDLPAAGLRHRRMHDARRTLVSVLRSSGVSDTAVRAVTHASTGDRILDAYTTWEWAGLCGELEKVKWGLPTPPTLAEVIPMGTNRVPGSAAGRKTP